MSSSNIVSETSEQKAVGPYNLARVAGNFVFLSGQVGLDKDNVIIPGGTVAEFKRIMQNIKLVLKTVGSDISKAVKVVVYLTDLADYAAMNEVYAQEFVEPFPVRTTVQVAGLPKGVHVEVEVTATLN